MMPERLTFWLGADAEPVWTKHIAEVEADAEAMRHMIEAQDE